MSDYSYQFKHWVLMKAPEGQKHWRLLPDPPLHPFICHWLVKPFQSLDKPITEVMVKPVSHWAGNACKC